MIKAANEGNADAFMTCWDPESDIYQGAKRLADKLPPLDKKKMYTAMNMPAEIDHFVPLSMQVSDKSETAATVNAGLEVWAGSDPPHKADKTFKLNFYMVNKEGKWYITKVSDK